ncbi:MAG: Ig-like domain-containing protein [Burkholderiaceae bacterium]|nr:Ig-like domain-containing protein [Burkholderiaceae bacterium]
MAIVLEAISTSGAAARVPLPASGPTTVPAEPGYRYRLVDEAGGRVAASPEVKRFGSDLVVEGLNEGQTLRLEGFFTRCAPQDSCALSLENLGGSAGETITPASEPIGAFSGGGFLMYASGAGAPAVPPPPEAGFDFKPLLAIGGGIAVLGGAGGGGGGGGGSSDNEAPAPPVIARMFTDQPQPVVTGTAEPGSTIRLTFSSATPATYTTTTGSDGNWRIDTGTASPLIGTPPRLAEGESIGIVATATDSAGNPSRPTTGTITLDSIPPTAPTIDTALLTNDATPTIGGTAEAGSQVTLRLLDRGSALDVTYVVTADGSGRWKVDVGSTQPSSGTLAGGHLGDTSVTGLTAFANDQAGNQSTSRAAELRVDTRIPDPPTIVTVAGENVAAPDDVAFINASEAASAVRVTGTLPAGYADRPVTVTWGTTTLSATVSGTGWEVEFPQARIPEDGPNAITATFTNAVGTQSTQGTQSVVIDRVAPNAPTISDDTSGTATGPVTYTFSFNEAVVGFTAGDVSVTNGTRGTFTQLNPSTYTLVVTPTAGAEGNLAVSVPAGAFTDLAGNPNAAGSAAADQPFDLRPPTVAITDSASGVANGAITYTFTFSEPVSGFSADDVVVSGGAKGAFTALDARTYTLVVTPPAGTEGEIDVSVPAGATVDAAGNASAAASAPAQAFDTLAPTLTITDSEPGATATGNVTFTFTFSEAVTGFGAGDINVSGGAKGAFSGSGAVYRLIVAPAADQQGTIEVSVAAGAAQDAAGNPSSGASASQGFDVRLPPSLVITDDVSGTASGPVTYTFEFSEPVSGFTAGDVEVIGVPAGSKGPLTGAGAVYRMVITPPAGAEGEIGVRVPAGVATDGAGNANLGQNAAPQLFDTVAPNPPTISDDTADTATGPVTFTFAFGEAVSGFTAGDVSVTNGTPGTFTQVSPSAYTLVVTPTAGAEGNMTVSVDAGTFTDLAGNPNAAGTAPYVQPFDLRPPTLTITDDASGVTNDPITYTFNFSEAVTGFDAGDVDVNGVPTSSKGPLTGSGAVYQMVVTPPAGAEGEIEVSVAAGAAADAAGNRSLAESASPQPFDTLAPAAPGLAMFHSPIIIGSNNTPLPDGGTTSDPSPGLTITFDEIFDSGSVAIFRNGAQLPVSIPPTNSQTVEYTDMLASFGIYEYSASMTDAAGNVGALAPSYTITYASPI